MAGDSCLRSDIQLRTGDGRSSCPIRRKGREVNLTKFGFGLSFFFFSFFRELNLVPQPCHLAENLP